MTPKLVILIVFSWLLCSCANQRVSSKDRLEAVSNIKLPPPFHVLKDEFQDMGQDYAVYYDLEFETHSIVKLIDEIQSSRLYHADGSSATYADSLRNGKQTDYSIWYPITKGYGFKGKDGGVLYSIAVDTSLKILKYHEYIL